MSEVADPSEESGAVHDNLPSGKLIEANNNLSNNGNNVDSCPRDSSPLNDFQGGEEVSDLSEITVQCTDYFLNSEATADPEELGQSEAENPSTPENRPVREHSESCTEGFDQPGTSYSPSPDGRPASGLSDTSSERPNKTETEYLNNEDDCPNSVPEFGVERRKRRQKTKQRLQCVKCCAYDFPNYATFHSHHLLHAYESFLLVSVARLPEQNPERLCRAEEMGTEQEDGESKRGPIKLTIKLSSLKESSSAVDDNVSYESSADFSNCYGDNDENVGSHFSLDEQEEISSALGEVEGQNDNLSEANFVASDDAHLTGANSEHFNQNDSEMQSDPLGYGQRNLNSTEAMSEVNDVQAGNGEGSPEGNSQDNDNDVHPLPTTKCAPCCMSFFSSEDLQKHVDSCHGDQQKCCRCEIKYDKIEDLIDHVRAEHASELNQEPDLTPVPIQPKAEPRDPKPTLKLRVIPSAQLMSSPSNTSELSVRSDLGSQNFGFSVMQDSSMNNAIHVNNGSPPVHMNSSSLTSMMNHMNGMAPGTFAHQMNGVLSSVPPSQPYPPFHPNPNSAGPRLYMSMDSRGQLPPSGAGPILQATLQQNPGQTVRIPRQPMPSSAGARAPPFRGGTPVQGRGRPLAPVPRNRLPMRPPMVNGMRPMQPPSNLARKRSTGPVLAGPPEKQSKADNDEIEVVAVRQRTTSQPTLAESHGLPRLPNSISVSVKTVTAAPEKNNDGGNVLASVLANRGITVTPATSEAPQQNQVVSSIAANLGPDVSVSPSTHNGPSRVPPPRPNHNFVAPLPPGHRPVTEKERPPRPPTVDLTVDQSQKMYTCQACKKRFPDVQKLKMHLESHINPTVSPTAPSPGGAFICNVCNCPFHSQHALEAHRQLSHPPKLNKVDSLAIPIVDLSDPGVTSRLSQLGIKTCLPVGKLASLGNGSYGIPLVSIDSRTGSSNFPLSSAILTLGSIQKLP